MPSLSIRNPSEVPPARRTTEAVREVQLQYEGFIQSINSDVGELELGPEDQARGAKVRLRHAARRLGKEIEIWDVDGRVYFKLATKRGRPRKTV